MTIRVFNLIISLVLCALIAWWFSILCYNPDGALAMAIGSFVTLAVTGAGAFAVRWSNERSGMMCRLLSYIFFFVFLILNLIFAFFTSWSIPLYCIMSGVIVCVYLLWTHWVFSTGL